MSDTARRSNLIFGGEYMIKISLSYISKIKKIKEEIEDFRVYSNEVKEDLQNIVKKHQQENEKLIKDLEFWHRTFRAFSVIPCAHCKKQMRVYPYGGAYYSIEDNKKVHATCYDEYLEERS